LSICLGMAWCLGFGSLLRKKGGNSLVGMYGLDFEAMGGWMDGQACMRASRIMMKYREGLGLS